LNADYTAVLADIEDGVDTNTTIDYAEAVVAINNASLLRTNISASSTAQLELNATVTAADLATARANLVSTEANAVNFINAYNSAVTANNALTAPTTAKVDTDTGALQGIIDATTANTAAFTAA
ncbi:hypothetical protein, partial [Pandoraea sputorum]